MQNYKKVLAIAITLLSGASAVAQTASPYTRYGYGRLYENSFGASKAMGGTSIGLRNEGQINPANPATYSVSDSTSFLFDVGVFAETGRFSENGVTRKEPNGGMEYVAMQFPLFKNMGASVGLMPFSSVGYRFGSYSEDNNIPVSYVYQGEGGLSTVYAGLSYNIAKRVAIGANAGYLFGKIDHIGTVDFADVSSNDLQRTERLRVRGLKTDFGIQYQQPFGKNYQLVLGATYSPKMNLSTELSRIEQLAGSSAETTERDANFSLPEAYGVGASLRYKNKWLIAADYKLQDFSQAEYYSVTDTLNRNQKISFGTEFTPNWESRNYLQRIKYRAGLYYSDSYLKIREESLREWGVSAGFGFPIGSRGTQGSILNLAVEYVNVRPTTAALIKEDYFRFTLNMTFKEFWFFKRKLD